MDEARHVETYSRYLDKIEIAYPINDNLKSLLDDVLSDSRWDMTYLGMQVLIEGLALAAFGLIRNTAGDPLGKAVNAYVMQDEARHVMFGRLALRDYYPQLTQAERDEREEFCADACYRMRDRFLADELWERLGYDPEACIAYVSESESQKVFRSLLFTRIVPTLKDVGLWGPKMRQTFADMGVIGYESTDLDGVMAEDEYDGRADGLGPPPHRPGHRRGEPSTAERLTGKLPAADRGRLQVAGARLARCARRVATRAVPALGWRRRRRVAVGPARGRVGTAGTPAAGTRARSVAAPGPRQCRRRRRPRPRPPTAGDARAVGAMR